MQQVEAWRPSAINFLARPTLGARRQRNEIFESIKGIGADAGVLLMLPEVMGIVREAWLPPVSSPRYPGVRHVVQHSTI